jgi:hypothetical protein
LNKTPERIWSDALKMLAEMCRKSTYNQYLVGSKVAYLDTEGILHVTTPYRWQAEWCHYRLSPWIKTALELVSDEVTGVAFLGHS